ncbi:extracellular solute-binding protein [Pseudonocardia broussonetiae]|uniref:Extracellular solute-binding protein n=1 Tax=Pseudonocardia broussonetiae TaxID=2736640 RepID=A0A6M6JDF2_9PSEU|nr:extracellular solute-binding protein [Pseudonocardia broussonetiae]QJY44511.1 extracellular solute-binding protein [Pseudonocardia broussonetiae]
MHPKARRSARPRRGHAVALALVLALLTACGSEGGGGASSGVDPAAAGDPRWQETVRAAEEEGTVVFYTSAVQGTIDRLEEAFEERYPAIDLQASRVPGVELGTALENERNAGGSGADIALHDMVPFHFRNLASFTPPTGPNTQRPEYQDEDVTLQGVSQMHHVVPYGLAYNTTLVPNPPTDFTALLDPALAGRIGLLDGAIPAASDLYGFLEQHYGGEDFLRRLADQRPQFFPTMAPTLQALTSGEIAMTDYSSVIAVQDLVDQGAPVAFVPTKPQWAIQFYTYVVGWAEHPNAAQVLYDFMASPEGQAVINENAISVLPDVPGTVGRIDDVQTMNVENVVDTDHVDTYNARWRQIFGR